MNLKIILLILLLLVLNVYYINTCLINSSKNTPFRITIRANCPIEFETPLLKIQKESYLFKLADYLCLDKFNVMMYVESTIYNSIKRRCIIPTIINIANIYFNGTLSETVHNEKRFKMIVFMHAAINYFSFGSEYCPQKLINTFLLNSFVLKDEKIDRIQTLIIFLRPDQTGKDKTKVEVYLKH